MSSPVHFRVVALSLGLMLLGACSQPGETELARGNVLASRNRLDEAAQAYRTAGEVAPKRARPRELLGHVLFDQGKHAEARAAYEDAIRVSADSLEGQIGLARLDAEQGQLDDALRRMDTLLTAQPDNLYARLSRATLAVKRGRPEDLQKAIEDTAFGMRIDEKNAAVLYTRGSAFLAAHEAEKAAETFRLLTERQPQSPLGFYGQARVLAVRGDKAGTLALLKESRVRSASSWKPSEILNDAAFKDLKADAAFVSSVEVL